MDISKLSHGAKLVLGGTIAFLIVSFFNWQEIEFVGIGSAGVSMWHGLGVIAGLLAIALIVWEGLRLVNIEVALPVGPAMTSAFLAILLAVFTILKFLVDGEYRTFWAWLGLALSIAVAAGAVMNMQAAGESFSTMKETLTAGAAAATTAAKSATESSSTPADVPATSAPETAAPSTPEAAAPSAAPEQATEQATDVTHEAADRTDEHPAS